MILIAGGTGRLGTALIRRRAATQEPIRVLTRQPERAVHLGERIDIAIGDLREPASLDTALEGIRLVVAAAQGFAGPGGVSPQSVDRDGNRTLIAAAQRAGAQVVLLSVVGAAVDHPMELFRMKAAAEQSLQESGIPATIVRATAFADMWLDLLRETAKRSGRPVVFGRGQNPINFVAVADVAHLLDKVIDDGTTRSHTLEIGGPEDLTFDQMADLLRSAAPELGPPRHVPRAALRTAAATVGRVRPQVRRQTLMALAMDRMPLTFDADDARQRFPDIRPTRVADLLAPA